MSLLHLYPVVVSSLRPSLLLLLLLSLTLLLSVMSCWGVIRVVGVEINARLVACANENLRANLPPPLTACVIKIPAEAFSPGMLQRPYLMAQGPWGDAAFHFRVILVDPPRAGLDKHTLRVCRRFEHVVYISCCPPSLARDLGGEQGLGSTHEVVRLAILDHFPNTKHIECAVYLRRRAQTHAPEDGQAK